MTAQAGDHKSLAGKPADLEAKQAGEGASAAWRKRNLAGTRQSGDQGGNKKDVGLNKGAGEYNEFEGIFRNGNKQAGQSVPDDTPVVNGSRMYAFQRNAARAEQEAELYPVQQQQGYDEEKARQAQQQQLQM